MDHGLMEPPVEHEHPDAHGSRFKRIMQPFIILFFLTAIEFLIAFTVSPGLFRVSIFIAMTIVKAFYIVSYFMHLKYEKIFLRWTIVLPFLFIVYLVGLLLTEGTYVFGVHPK